ncbi:MAG: hypothetical protein ACLGSD_13845 [Acidobacteriota bacterium]
MDFKLAPTGLPFDGEVKSDPNFKLAPIPSFLPETPQVFRDPGDALGGTNPGDGATRFNKMQLAPVPDDDYFGPAGAIAHPVRTAAGGSAFKLAGMPDSDFAGLGDAPNPESPGGEFVKGAAGVFEKFAQFTKVQEQPDGTVTVYGIATHEAPDLENEICDYDAAKDAYQQWSLGAVQRTSGAGQEISLGNIRRQHSTEPAGKVTKIDYDDSAKEIRLGSVPINDDIREQLQQGFLTGYSQGGSYAWRKCDNCDKSLPLQQANNYCPNCKKNVPVRFGLKRLSEVSYVDSPCTGKGFDYVRADGSSKHVAFAKRTDQAPAGAVKVLSTENLTKRVSKSVVQVGSRKVTVLHGEWLDGEPFRLIA